MSQNMTLSGHIVDSLNLIKVFDEITDSGGELSFERCEIGKTRRGTSKFFIQISAPTYEA